MDLVYRDIVFVDIFFGKYPHRHTSDLLLARNTVGLPLYLRRFPEPLVDILVHIRVLDIVVDLKERSLIGILEIVVGPGAGKTQIPVVSCIDHDLHLLVIITPACRIDIQLHTDLITDIFVDLLNDPALILLRIPDLPPGQLHDFFTARISLRLLLAAACEKSCRHNHREACRRQSS